MNEATIREGMMTFLIRFIAELSSAPNQQDDNRDGDGYNDSGLERQLCRQLNGRAAFHNRSRTGSLKFMFALYACSPCLPFANLLMSTTKNSRKQIQNVYHPIRSADGIRETLVVIIERP